MSDGVREAFALSREGSSVPEDELTRIWFISSGTLRSEVVMMLNREKYCVLCSDSCGRVVLLLICPAIQFYDMTSHYT